MFMSSDDEANLQRALAGIYDGRDQDAVQALATIEAGRPGFPAPAVYRALLAYWRALADPGNAALLDRFRKASDEAIRISTAWTEAHPADAEGWRYLANAFEQRSQFAVSVAPNKGDVVRYGVRARETATKAQAMDKSDKDILVGVGAANYFVANMPWYLRPAAYTVGVHGGDRERGLDQMKQGMNEGPHSKVEGAMVLAGALYSEESFGEFYRVITEHVTSAHPRLLPAAGWAITGGICAGMTGEALTVAQGAAADDTWRYLQLGRIALAKKSLAEAEQDFSKAIGAAGANRSDLAWAYYGRSLTRVAAKQSDGGDMKRAKETSSAAYELAKYQFQKPGACHS
jgi:tetratricopeptide (TPR) repeat protein